MLLQDCMKEGKNVIKQIKTTSRDTAYITLTKKDLQSLGKKAEEFVIIKPASIKEVN